MDHPSSAFCSAYREHFTFVWRTLLRLGVPSDEVEDALQEVFVIAFRRWADIRDQPRTSDPSFGSGVGGARAATGRERTACDGQHSDGQHSGGGYGDDQHG